MLTNIFNFIKSNKTPKRGEQRRKKDTKKSKNIGNTVRKYFQNVTNIISRFFVETSSAPLHPSLENNELFSHLYSFH